MYKATKYRELVPFLCACSPFARKTTTVKKTSKHSSLFINRVVGLRHNQFKGVHMNGIPFVEDLLTPNIVQHGIDFVDGIFVGELARRSVQRYENTARLLRYNNHICCVNNINAVFQSFPCPTCETFIKLKQHLTTCNERVKNIHSRNFSQVRQTLFGELNFFGIKYTSQRNLFKNLAKFAFESIYVRGEIFKETESTTWIGKHVPISVSTSSNLLEEPIFLYNSNPHYLFSLFIGTLEGLALQNKAKKKLIFLDNGTTIKINLGSFLEILTNLTIDGSKSKNI